ncbi:MAG: zinc ribbon domain-containing protein, partial [Flavobacteriales bacterium]|nr:zinc ribbon domain-containing protein [Flavobacteriales bacterium]
MNKVECTNCNKENPVDFKYCSDCGYELPQTQVTELEDVPVNSATDNQSNKKRIVGIVVGIIAFSLSYYTVQQLFLDSPSYDKVLMETASELNKSCPMMVDSDTRLDNTIALPDNIFQYNYTLVNLELSEINVGEVKTN